MQAKRRDGEINVNNQNCKDEVMSQTMLMRMIMICYVNDKGNNHLLLFARIFQNNADDNNFDNRNDNDKIQIIATRTAIDKR